MMAHARTERRGAGPLTDVLNAYLEVRHEREDQVWAERAMTAFVIDGARDAVVSTELRRALRLSQESGEGPEDLYGPPVDWARGRMAELSERGTPVQPSIPDLQWRDVPVIGCFLAAVGTVLITVLLLIRTGLTMELTWALLLAPLLMAMTGVVTLTVWERTLARASRSMAALAAVGTLAAGVAATVLLMVNGQEHVIATLPTFAYLALSLVYGALAFAADKLLPGVESHSQPLRHRSDIDDQEWQRELGGILRLRLELQESRVREVQREARAHARSPDGRSPRSSAPRPPTPRASRATGPPPPAARPGSTPR